MANQIKANLGAFKGKIAICCKTLLNSCMFLLNAIIEGILCIEGIVKRYWFSFGVIDLVGRNEIKYRDLGSYNFIHLVT